ncbi:hypothetical protein [Parapedobacter koreensis]|uniref:Late embryogenesis abundant protein n=1 Tax=Parapedobacter koreensis TaxID=332977 RepID=A0A1H7SKC2_9SPHI|nr:hypothetical protein [Parapedobacter koreensis]SEL73121.1 hypothetical protein SAMN05421740_10939 [Parapedobacter koreensis]
MESVTPSKQGKTTRTKTWTKAKNGNISFILLITIGTAFFLVSCTLDKQAKALRALEKCRYEFVSADSVFLAGTDINKFIANGRLDISRLPGVALGFLNRDIPLSGILRIQITNPTDNLAGISQFAYKIAIEDKEVIDGTSDLPIEVPPGQTITVPVKLQTNVYKFLSDGQTLDRLLTFIQRAQSGTADEKINLTFNIKPTLALGNKQINYPGYIRIDKQVDADLLIKNGLIR